MKKLTDLIVEKRFIILPCFIFLSIICLFLSQKVKINYDISAYLPDSSETKIGKNIMENNFKSTGSTLNIMFTDLEHSKKESVKKTLENIKDVDSVLYEDTEEYNKDNYTLYVLTINAEGDSKVAADVYQKVMETFKEEKLATSGNIADQNKPVLHLWIIVVAIVAAMLILIIMCESYVEPFLFLFAIGLAVFMNMGTNIIFSSVSNITNAISAILQLALSMDYSIMLMNRYSQEREENKDKETAMKKALQHAFSSISSSSVTTIVGLLALVFMSFTIGRDLGFVLAKGVLFSLISIFLSLPAFILLFDHLILKTKKKSVTLHLDFLGRFANKMRYPAIVLFILLFGISFILKNGVTILYTGNENDEIAQVFTETNTIAIVYKNEYEKEVADFCNSLSDNEKIDKALCLGNTIGEELDYKEVNSKIKDLGMDTTIDEYLLKIIYYNYYKEDSKNQLTFDEFFKFIDKEVLENKELKKKINKGTKENLKLLKQFTNKKNINKTRTIKEISSLLGIEENKVKDIVTLYHAENINTKISLASFINFLNKDIVSNKKYASLFDKETKATLKMLSSFANQKKINTKMDSKEISKLFGMNEESIKNILLLYNREKVASKHTLKEVLVGIEDAKRNTHYLDHIDVSTFLALKPFIENKENMNETKWNKFELTQIFSKINSDLVSMVYTVGSNTGLLTEATEFTPIEFLQFTLKNFNTLLKEEEKRKIETLLLVMKSSTTDTKYSSKELAQIMHCDETVTKNLYALMQKNTKLTPIEFVDFLISSKDTLLQMGGLDKEAFEVLKQLQRIMLSVQSGKKYTTKEMSSILGINVSQVNLIYSLYDLNKTSVKVSLNHFVDYLLHDVLKRSDYASSIDSNSKKKLDAIYHVMQSSLKEEKLSANETFIILSKLTDEMDKNLVDLLFLYEGSINDYKETWKMSLEEIISYIHDEMLTDKTYKDFLDKEMKKKVNKAYDKVGDAKDLLVTKEYSRAILNTKYKVEGEETYHFLKMIKEQLNQEGIYIIGDSPMALEMNNSFGQELDFITILTMLAIFVVVAITFKSFVIPVILVLIIQCAVYITMSILSLSGTDVYFISLLIVQSILMGATIDYAIVYTSYYLEYRNQGIDVKESLINAYNHSIHTILTSSSILVIVTLIVGQFASQIAAKICMTLSKGTLCSTLLILFILPPILAASDKFIVKRRNMKKEK